jgi:hypothetical protein
MQKNESSDTSHQPEIAWGARAIGEVISRNERQTHHLLESGRIACARKVGAMWCASRRSLLREFGGEGAR